MAISEASASRMKAPTFAWGELLCWYFPLKNVLLTVLDLIDWILVWGSWRISASGVPGVEPLCPEDSPVVTCPRLPPGALARLSLAAALL